MQIAILSRQASLYSTRRLTEAARRLGHRVRVLDPLELPVEIGYAQPRLVETLPRLDAIVPRIGASITELGCAVVRQFENNRVWTINPSVGIAGSRDKLLSLQMLSEGGIPVPRTAVVGHPSQLEKAIESVGGLPVVLKLRRGTQGKGVVLVHSLVAARRVHSFLADFQQYTLVQEYVSEARNRDIRVIVLGETAIAAMERRAAPGEFRANLHRGATARAYPLDRELTQIAVKSAQIHELGLAGVDIIMTARGPAVIEVNSSPGLQGIEKATGMDIAYAVIQHSESRVRLPSTEPLLPEHTP